MQGNVKKQMIRGIDYAQCVVVFVTRRYVDKVKGDNAEDNCQVLQSILYTSGYSHCDSYYFINNNSWSLTTRLVGRRPIK